MNLILRKIKKEKEKTRKKSGITPSGGLKYHFIYTNLHAGVLKFLVCVVNLS
jgi:hypothetical protein